MAYKPHTQLILTHLFTCNWYAIHIICSRILHPVCMLYLYFRWPPENCSTLRHAPDLVNTVHDLVKAVRAWCSAQARFSIWATCCRYNSQWLTLWHTLHPSPLTTSEDTACINTTIIMSHRNIQYAMRTSLVVVVIVQQPHINVVCVWLYGCIIVG